MDSRSTFVKRFGDLVALLRLDPSNDAAQDLALNAAAAAVADRGLEVEAGVEWSAIPDDMPLKTRMLARQVDCIRIAAGAAPEELHALARALAHDVTPIVSSPSIEVEFVRLLAPPAPVAPEEPDGPGGGSQAASARTAERRSRSDRRRGGDRRVSGRRRWWRAERRRGERRVSGERRIFLLRDLHAQASRLLDALAYACRLRAWEDALYAAGGLIGLAQRIPREERGTFGIRVRRALPRPVLEALVALAERDYVVRERAAELLAWVGLDAVEVVLDRLREGEVLGARAFLYDVVSRVPAAYAVAVAMLRSPLAHEIRHGAALLGRLGLPGAAAELERLLDHPDELVRTAAVQALAELHDAPVAEALRRALRHPSARTRAAAADAIALWRGGVLALLIAAVLRDETDRETWQAMVEALGRIGSAEACAALAGVAMTRRSILRRQGYTTGQRLAAVAALGLAGTAEGHRTLERLARESDGVVGYAADRVLQAEGRRAG